MAELLQVDCEMCGLSSDHYSVTLRRYAGMALTNLTFGDVANKVRTRSECKWSLRDDICPFCCCRYLVMVMMLCCSALTGHAVLHEGLHEGNGGPAQVGQRRPAAGGSFTQTQ